MRPPPNEVIDVDVNVPNMKVVVALGEIWSWLADELTAGVRR